MSLYTTDPSNIPAALRRLLAGGLSSSGVPLPTDIMISTNIPVNSTPQSISNTSNTKNLVQTTMSQQFPPVSTVNTVTPGNKKKKERRSDYKSPFDSSESDGDDDNGLSAKIESIDRAVARHNKKSNNTSNNATRNNADSNNASTVATTVARTSNRKAAVAQDINDNDDMSDILSVGTIKGVPIDIDDRKQQQQSYVPQQQTISYTTPSPTYPSQYMYCEHCETAANCHNHRYGSFLEKKLGDINETGPLDHMQMYKKFVDTYSTLREFHMSEEETNPSNILVSLPLCIYGGAFRKCMTKHITAAINRDHVRTNRTTTGGTVSKRQSLTQDSCSTTRRRRRAPTSAELNSHSQWVAARSASVKRARKFK
jgi:hypothetical protein